LSVALADTIVYTSIVGIVVSGVVGPAATAWGTRRAARKQFIRDREAKRREDLRELLDEAASLLGVGAIRLRELREASGAGETLPDEVRAWPASVYTMGQRLQLRLGRNNEVVSKYDQVRQRLVETDGVTDRDGHENAIRRFEGARDCFLEAARTELAKPIKDKEPSS
jgi:hypothetical protein